MNKKIFKSLLSLVVFVSAFTIQAQESGTFFGRSIQNVSPDGKIRCVSTEYNQYLQETKPELYIVNDIDPNIVYREIDQVENTGVITMPVVVHVIHNGQAVGVGPNISDAQVLSQIQVLNQDFRRMMGTPGYNTHASGADIQIEFCLAQVDPFGNPTNGINRVNLSRSSWNSENLITSEIMALHRWNSNQYYNIYVVNFGGNLSDTLGYAMLPNVPSTAGLQGLPGGQGSTIDDGFVIGYKFFGSKLIHPGGNYEYGYDEGRTSTHEMGHALGLLHIWGDSSSCSVDDFCNDTPAQNSPNFGCPNNAYSCSSADMYRNYMDYTQDSCMNIFTNDQKNRVRKVMQYGVRRASLATSTVCNAPASVGQFDMNMIKLHPNPATNEINLVTSDNWDMNGNVAIYNSVGQIVYQGDINNANLYTIDVSGFSQGVYFVKIQKDNDSKTLQFVKK